MATTVAPEREKVIEKGMATVFVSNGYSVDDITYDRNDPGAVAEVEGKVAALTHEGYKLITKDGPVPTFDPEAEETTLLAPFAAG